MILEDKIALVKKTLLDNIPDCHYTITILLWDDGTDSVQCRHGDGEKTWNATYYNNKLTFKEEDSISGRIKVDAKGNEIFVLNQEEFNKIK